MIVSRHGCLRKRIAGRGRKVRRAKWETLNSFSSLFISAAKAIKDPSYAQAIIDGYARAKLSKGKNLEEVSPSDTRALVPPPSAFRGEL
jgi:hypothetical protein